MGFCDTLKFARKLGIAHLRFLRKRIDICARVPDSSS
jgi:hypothetical protein